MKGMEECRSVCIVLAERAKGEWWVEGEEMRGVNEGASEKELEMRGFSR